MQKFLEFGRSFVSIILLSSALMLNTSIAKGQNVQIDSNRILIDSVEKLFTRECIGYHKNKISRTKYKKDIEVIMLLNKIYELPIDTSIIAQVPNSGFYLSPRVMQTETDEIFLFARNAGNLRGMVKITRNKATGDIERKIIIATNTKYYCKTAKSANWFLLDFGYVKRVVWKIDFPLQLSRYCSELESKHNR